jgi:hypothetical protein
MIQTNLMVYMMLIHFLADFGLQTHDQANNKSTSNKWLFYHVGVYSLIWLIAYYCFTNNILGSAIFASITFICHYITDYITSRIGKSFWDKKDLHNGFTIVGFDQLLHYIQLIFTYKILASYGLA